MAQLRIGWSEKSITLEKKIALAGQFAERISQYVEKPITATALAVENGEDQMILVSCDVESVYWGLLEKVRANLAGNTLGLDPMKIVLSAIHTHTGPAYNATRSRGTRDTFRGLRGSLEKFLAPGQKYVEKENISDNPELATPDEVTELLEKQITAAVLEAWENRKPGSFTNAFGRAAVGQCRRVAFNDNTAQMWGNANSANFTELESGNDSGIELLYIFDEAKQLTGIVANLACPAQCVQHRLFVSPDFWGEVKMLLRQHFGEHIFLLTQCSAAGDQCPVDMIRWVEPESPVNDPNIERENPPVRKADPSMFDLAGMRKTGKRIAREIIDLWDEGLDAPQTDPVLEHKVESMWLPIRRATLTDMENAKRSIKEYLRDKNGADVDYNDVAKLQTHLGVLNRGVNQETEDVLEVEIHTVRLGTVAIATNPFELFLDYGNQIKARSAAEQTFLIQLANGSEGYLPTQKAEIHGHYSAFISSGHVGHAGGEQLVRQTLQNIRELFKD